MEVLSIGDLEQEAGSQPVEAALHVQLETCFTKTTKQGKGYYELAFTDGNDHLKLRVWSDHPMYAAAAGLRRRAFLRLEGRWVKTERFGIDAQDWNCRELTDAERQATLQGSAQGRQQLESDFSFIGETLAGLADPRLQVVCQRFLRDHGERMRRTAAAREYHHARRGGLVEHVAQMMRCASALAGVYEGVNRDLLLAGVLFHDCGKLWETACEKEGFSVPYQETGELLGHITLGIEVINKLWRDLLDSEESAGWLTLEPPSDDVRRHLLHLVASHHGAYEFGSPVLPKTPEALLLHFIDNIDAKMEMMRGGYARGERLAPRVFQRVRPLPANLVGALPSFVSGVEGDGEGDRGVETGEEGMEDEALPGAAQADQNAK